MQELNQQNILAVSGAKRAEHYDLEYIFGSALNGAAIVFNMHTPMRIYLLGPMDPLQVLAVGAILGAINAACVCGAHEVDEYFFG